MPRKKRISGLDSPATQRVVELWGIHGDVRDYAMALGFTVHAVRMMLQNRDENGLNEITTRRGPDLLATPEDFVKWLREYSAATASDERREYETEESETEESEKCWHCGAHVR